MNTNLQDLMRAIGSVIEGCDNETVLKALAGNMTKEIVNNSGNESEARDMATRCADFLVSSIHDAFEVLAAKGYRP